MNAQEKPPARIYTDVTRNTAPIGGIWSEQPFAMVHDVYVSLDEHRKVVEANEALVKALERVERHFLGRAEPEPTALSIQDEVRAALRLGEPS